MLHYILSNLIPHGAHTTVLFLQNTHVPLPYLVSVIISETKNMHPPSFSLAFYKHFFCMWYWTFIYLPAYSVDFLLYLAYFYLFLCHLLHYFMLFLGRFLSHAPAYSYPCRALKWAGISMIDREKANKHASHITKTQPRRIPLISFISLKGTL